MLQLAEVEAELIDLLLPPDPKKPKGGGDGIGATKAGKGVKIMIMVDARGLPVAALNGSPLIAPIVSLKTRLRMDALFVVISAAGRSNGPLAGSKTTAVFASAGKNPPPCSRASSTSPAR